MSEQTTSRDAVLSARPIEEVMDRRVYGRIMAALTHQEPDRVPIWDLIDSWPTFEHFASGETDPISANVKVYNGLAIDLCRGLYMPADPASEGRQFDGGNHKSKMSGLTCWMVEYPIKTLDDVRAWRCDPLTEEQVWAEAEHIVRIRDALAPQTMYVPGRGMGFHEAYGMMGLAPFCLALHDAPEQIERIIDTLNARSCVHAKVYAEANICPMYFIGDDIAYKGRTMFSLQTLRELFFPYLKRMCEPLVNAGIEVIYHTDGYIMDIIDDLLDCGVSGLNPLEPLAGNDIAAIKKRYGDNLVLVGGMDCSQLLPLGSPQDVREGVKQLLREAGHSGGLFIGSSSEIVPATPLENILTFYEACQEFGRYPLQV